MRGLVLEAHYAKNLDPGRGSGFEKEMLWTECMCPPNLCIDILTLKVMVLGGVAFGGG